MIPKHVWCKIPIGTGHNPLPTGNIDPAMVPGMSLTCWLGNAYLKKSCCYELYYGQKLTGQFMYMPRCLGDEYN